MLRGAIARYSAVFEREVVPGPHSAPQGLGHERPQ